MNLALATLHNAFLTQKPVLPLLAVALAVQATRRKNPLLVVALAVQATKKKNPLLAVALAVQAISNLNSPL
jgi:P2-related tail formation protein